MCGVSRARGGFAWAGLHPEISGARMPDIGSFALLEYLD